MSPWYSIVPAVVLWLSPMPERVVDPHAGEWVTYRGTSGSGLTFFLRIAAVETAAPEGMVWIEVEAGLSADLLAPLVQMKCLARIVAGRLTGQIETVLAAAGHARAVKWMGSLLEGSLADPKSQGPLPKGFRFTRSPPSMLATEAGEVTAHSWTMLFERRVIQRVWLSEQVPLLRMVSIEVPELGQALFLHAMGKGAKARVPLAVPASRTLP